MASQIQEAQSDTQVVAKALINIKDALGLSAAVVGQIIGTGVSTITHIEQNKDLPDNKVYEASVLFICVYRSLYTLLGGDQKAMIHWFNSKNKDFNDEKPVDVMKSPTGLAKTVQYLDANAKHF